MNKISTVAFSALVAGTATAASAAPLAVLSTGIPGGAAVNQADLTQAAVGIGVIGGCSVRLSGDGGHTWIPAALPQPQPAVPRTYCGEGAPAVLYSNDGTRLYAAYPYKTTDVYGSTVSGTLVSQSADRGITWSAPSTAIPEVAVGEDVTEIHDLMLAVSPDSPWMYLIGTETEYFGNNIAFYASVDNGVTWWGNNAALTASRLEGTVLSDRASIAAGANGIVLIAYGKVVSTLTPEDNQWAYVKVARSADNGASFTQTQIARYNVYNNGAWLTEPDIKIAHYGIAHLVFDKGRNGVFYDFSAPPYTRWTQFPIGAAPRGYVVKEPHISTGLCGGKTVLGATWVESLDAIPPVHKLAYTYKPAINGFRWAPPAKADLPSVGYYLNTSYIAEVGANAIVAAGEWVTGINNPFTVFGLASSGIVCR